MLLPGGSLGVNGSLVANIVGKARGTSSVNGTLRFRIKFGGSTVWEWDKDWVNQTSETIYAVTAYVVNQGATNVQLVWGQVQGTASTTGGTQVVGDPTDPPAAAAVDTTADQTFAVTAQWTTANATNTYTRQWASATVAQN